MRAFLAALVNQPVLKTRDGNFVDMLKCSTWCYLLPDLIVERGHAAWRAYLIEDTQHSTWIKEVIGREAEDFESARKQINAQTAASSISKTKPGSSSDESMRRPR